MRRVFGFVLWLVFGTLYVTAPGLAQTPASLDVPVLGGGSFTLYDKSAALLVAGAEYDDPAWAPLRPTLDDVAKLGKFLEGRGFEVTTLRSPSSTELRQTLETFLSDPALERGRAIVYFAGHGYSSPRDNFTNGYLVTRDSPNPELSDEGFRIFTERALSTRYLVEMAGATTVEGDRGQNRRRPLHTLFIADSCFSGALFETRALTIGDLGRLDLAAMKALSQTFWEDVRRRKGFQVITAGSEFQTVPARSPMVELLITGMTDAGADQQGRGFTTANELGIWLRYQLAGSTAALTPQSGSIGNLRGDMVLRTSRMSEILSGDSTSTDIEVADRSVIRAINSSTNANQPADAVLVDSAGGEVRTVAGTDIITLSDVPTAEELGYPEDLLVYYYRKSGDGNQVISVLDSLNMPYVSRPAQLTAEKSTMIACHPDSDVKTLKKLAIGLLEAGVEVRRIRSYRNPAAKAVSRFEILSFTPAPYRSLTVADIEALESCPRMLLGERL